MVDAVVGLLILAALSLSLAQAFVAIGLWDVAEASRIDALTASLDAGPHATWY